MLWPTPFQSFDIKTLKAYCPNIYSDASAAARLPTLRMSHFQINKVHKIIPSYQDFLCGVVVITLASHAVDPSSQRI